MEDAIYPEGTIIDGRYRIERRLGRGGFATVYQAEHLQLGRRAALKVLEPIASQITERFRARFNTEARIAANLDHPNVVRIFDFGFIEGDDRPYIAMEMLEGRDLKAWLEAEGSMDPQRAKRLFLPVLDALRIGHDRGIVHKDLKPSNLYFVKEGTEDERLVVLDYGIARLEGDDNPRHTEEGSYTGTPAYMPPEYIQRREVTPAYDVYQIGLIFIEAMTGQPVVVAGSSLAYMVAHVEGKHRIPDDFTDTPLGASLVKAIAVDPGNRYADGGEMMAALEIADVTAGTDFTLPAITLDEADQARISDEESQSPQLPADRHPPQERPKSGLPIGAIVGVVVLLGLGGCLVTGVLASLWLLVDDDVIDDAISMTRSDPATVAPPPSSVQRPQTPEVPNVPAMPTIGAPSSAGDEMHAWLLSRYMILTTLNQVHLYQDLLKKLGGWDKGEVSFVPSRTGDLLQLASDQMQIGLDSPPRRRALEKTADGLIDDFGRLRTLLDDLYDYHSVRRGWESDGGAHGQELTRQLAATTRSFEPKYERWSEQVDAALMKHLAKREDELASDPFLQAATRAMIAEATLIREMTKRPNSAKSNEALSKFDKTLDALQKQIRANRPALDERYTITAGLHERFLGSLKETRKQAGDIRAEARKGEDVKGDTIFLWMQLHMTFGSYNQLQRYR